MKNEVVEVCIKNVVKTSTGVVLLLGNEQKSFVIYMDLVMGEQVYNLFNQSRPNVRPLSYNLIYNLCLGFCIELQRVVIIGMDKGVFFARIILKQKNDELTRIVELDARPSDAILLALVNQKNIFVAKELFDDLPDANDLVDKLAQ